MTWKPPYSVVLVSSHQSRQRVHRQSCVKNMPCSCHVCLFADRCPYQSTLREGLCPLAGIMPVCRLPSLARACAVTRRSVNERKWRVGRADGWLEIKLPFGSLAINFRGGVFASKLRGLMPVLCLRWSMIGLRTVMYILCCGYRWNTDFFSASIISSHLLHWLAMTVHYR